MIHLHGMSRADKSIEKESKLVVATGSGKMGDDS